MAKERLKNPRARLFIALDLPEPVREGLVAWQAAECVDPALRPVAPQALHMTLCFLGYHPEKAIDRIGRLIGAAEQGPVPMRLEPDPVALPPRQPRLFAIGAQSGTAVALQAELAAALQAERLYRPEKRDFWPHVTVTRVRPERRRRGSEAQAPRGRGKPEPVERVPGPLPAALCVPFGAVRIALYRSILRPQGAEYVSLASVDLPPAEGDSKR